MGANLHFLQQLVGGGEQRIPDRTKGRCVGQIGFRKCFNRHLGLQSDRGSIDTLFQNREIGVAFIPFISRNPGGAHRRESFLPDTRLKIRSL